MHDRGQGRATLSLHAARDPPPLSTRARIGVLVRERSSYADRLAVADANEQRLYVIDVGSYQVRWSQAPDADGDIWSSEAFRITALSSDCRHAFVTHGGDGKTSVINTAAGEVKRVIMLPTKLSYGGYLISIRARQELLDTIGR